MSKIVDVFFLNLFVGPFLSILILLIDLFDIVSHELIKNPVFLIVT